MNRTAVTVVGLALLVGLGALAWQQLGQDPPAVVPDDPAPDQPGAPPEPDRANGSILPPPPAPPDVVQVLLNDLRTRPEAPPEEELLPLTTSPEGVDRLLEFLRTEKDLEKRAVVLQVLARSPFGRATKAVVAAARGDSGRELRPAAVLALAVVDEEGEALPTLREIALGEGDVRLAGTALQALAYRNSPDSQKALIDVLRSAPGIEKRVMLYRVWAGEVVGEGPDEPEAILRIRHGRTNIVIPQPETMEAFGEFLEWAQGERDATAALAAGVMLVRLPDPRAKDAYLTLFEASEEPLQEAFVVQMDPRASGEHYAGLVGRAARMERSKIRRLIATRLEDAEDPHLLASLREWGEIEADPAIRESIDKAIARLAALEERR